MSLIVYPKNHCNLSDYGGPDLDAMAIQQTIDYPIRPFAHYRVWFWDKVLKEFCMASGPESFQSPQEAFAEAARRLNARCEPMLQESVDGYGGGTFRLWEKAAL
jgi:hypothetical protein